MANKSQPVKGFRDFIGEEARKRFLVRRLIEKTFENYGFEPAETPVIEYEEFVRGNNADDETVSDIFKLKDKGKRELALRYEFTFQLKRLAKNQKLPFKRYQIGPVFRDEPTSAKGARFRQFTQCDADTIGSGPNEEAETFAMLKRILDSLDIKFEIKINNRKLLNEILEEAKIKDEEKTRVIREIDKLDKLPESEVAKNLGEYNAQKLLKIFKKPEKDFEKYSKYAEIKQLKKLAKEYGVELKFSPSLARGLSYYNGTIFEVKTRELSETICAGGAFMVDKTQSFGASFGLERIAGLANAKDEDKQTLIISLGRDKDSIKISEKLRDGKINATLLLDKSPAKALEYANSKNIKKVLIVGEKDAPKVTLKDMETGKEEKLSEKELLEKITQFSLTSSE